jgi:hypothetical protein
MKHTNGSAFYPLPSSLSLLVYNGSSSKRLIFFCPNYYYNGWKEDSRGWRWRYATNVNEENYISVKFRNLVAAYLQSVVELFIRTISRYSSVDRATYANVITRREYKERRERERRGELNLLTHQQEPQRHNLISREQERERRKLRQTLWGPRVS